MVKESKRKVAGFLAIFTSIGFFAIIIIQMFHAIPVENKDYHNLALAALFSLANGSYGYYLGSSDGSARKSELQAHTEESRVK